MSRMIAQDPNKNSKLFLSTKRSHQEFQSESNDHGNSEKDVVDSKKVYRGNDEECNDDVECRKGNDHSEVR